MKWGTNGSGQFLFPCGIAIDNEKGFVNVSDNSRGEGGSGSDNTARIQKFDLSGNFIRQWITTDNDGNGVLALDSDGNVLAILHLSYPLPLAVIVTSHRETTNDITSKPTQTAITKN